jgi:DNA-binding Lrp family transcriptional regulator
MPSGRRSRKSVALGALQRQASANTEDTALKTIFIMVKCELGQAYKVADEAVENVEQVSEVHSTSGQYDLLMKCYLSDDQDIGHFVNEEIQTLPGVKDTFTLIAFKAFT